MEVITFNVSKNGKFLEKFDFVGNKESPITKFVKTIYGEYNITSFPAMIKKLFEVYLELFNTNLNLLIIFFMNIDRQSQDDDVIEITM